MENLCGLGSLQVIYHRFSDGVQVVRCVLDFFKSMSDVEQSYSQSIARLVRSSAYTFHSNILMQWLGSDPYEEIGTVKHCWQQLGTELSRLADHHSSKAEGYLTPVRIKLQTLLPKLEEMRLKLKNRIQQLRTTVEVAEKIHSREKQKYMTIGDSCLRLRGRLDSEVQGGAFKMKMTEHREAVLTRDLELQEKVYRTAHEDLTSTYHNFNRDVEELYKEVEQGERERVKTLKECLQEFTKTLSNTAPVYLESMGKIVITIDQIDASGDITRFVDAQTDLSDKLCPPQFEQHQAVSLSTSPLPKDQVFSETPRNHTETDSMLNGNRSPSIISQKSMSNESIEGDTEKVKDQNIKVNHEEKRLEIISMETKKPSLRPKPGVREQPSKSHSITSSSQSPDPIISSSSHVSSSSSHVTSSSSHVSKVIEQFETPQESNSTHWGSNVSRPHENKHTTDIVLPSVRSLEQNTDSAKAVTHNRGDELLVTLEQLQQLAVSNDCYTVLGVESVATLEEITGARRDKSRLLHPDHFTGQPEKRQRAEEQLSWINQIYQNVLKNPDKRELYDKLCHFRKFYQRIPEQVNGLDKAKIKLEDHVKLMKKAQFPMQLQEELQLAVTLLKLRMAQLPHNANS